MPATTVRRIQMPDEGIETLYGPFDEHLRSLESALGVTLKTQGHELIIEGAPDEVGRAEKVVDQLGRFPDQPPGWAVVTNFRKGPVEIRFERFPR